MFDRGYGDEVAHGSQLRRPLVEDPEAGDIGLDGHELVVIRHRDALLNRLDPGLRSVNVLVRICRLPSA